MVGLISVLFMPNPRNVDWPVTIGASLVLGCFLGAEIALLSPAGDDDDNAMSPRFCQCSSAGARYRLQSLNASWLRFVHL